MLGVFEWEVTLWRHARALKTARHELHNTLEAYRRLDLRNQVAAATNGQSRVCGHHPYESPQWDGVLAGGTRLGMGLLCGRRASHGVSTRWGAEQVWTRVAALQQVQPDDAIDADHPHQQGGGACTAPVEPRQVLRSLL